VRSRYGRVVALLLTVALLATLAVGCSSNSPSGGTTPKSSIKTAMVTDIGGLGDKSFNDLSYDGLKRAETDFGVTIKVLESSEAAQYEPNLTQLASAGYDPIFAVGFLMQDTVSKVSTAFPDVTFAGIDQYFDPTIPNVIGLNFKEQEAAYLAGIVAGMLTTMTDVDPRINAQPVVGFVGGMEIPAVIRFKVGFEAGVAKANPAVSVKSIYTGSFTDQQKGKEAALSLIGDGCDIVFAAAGSTGVGSFTACQEQKALFIGVDADQFLTLTNPGDTIITSAVKRVDNAVYATVKAAVDNNVTAGVNQVFGLKDDGVGLAPFHDWDSIMPQTIKDAVNTAKQDVIDGTVTVPSS
jgi:basic membrane protein A